MRDGKLQVFRKNLMFRNKELYIAVFILNFFMRCSWTLTISPALIAEKLGI
jgi:hypothetical protein